MISFISSVVWDLVWLAVSLAVLWAVVNHFFPGFKASLKRASKVERAKRKRIRTRVGDSLKEEAVFHVSSTDGKTRIVVAKDEAEAERIGRQALDSDDVVVAEVYDKVVRR